MFKSCKRHNKKGTEDSIPEKENLSRSFREYNTLELSAFCNANSVDYAVREDDHFHYLTTGVRCTIEYDVGPGMVDASADLECLIHICKDIH